MIDNIIGNNKTDDLACSLMKHLDEDFSRPIATEPELYTSPPDPPQVLANPTMNRSELEYLLSEEYPKKFVFPTDNEIDRLMVTQTGAMKTDGYLAGKLMSILFTDKEELMGRIDALSTKQPDGKYIHYNQLCPNRIRIIAYTLQKYFPSNIYMNIDGSYTPYFKNKINGRCQAKNRKSVPKCK